MLGASLIGIGPACLIAFAIWAARGETVGSLPALLFAALIALAGPLVYFSAKRWGTKIA
jgi:hypothetical protein